MSAQTQQNKEVVLRGLHELFNLHDLTALERYWSPNYIQHNPIFGDGPAGLRTLVQSTPSIKFEAGIVVAEGDKVIVHGRYSIEGQTPLIAADIFIVKDGKLQEHWDILQNESAPTNHSHVMFPSPADEFTKNILNSKK